MKCFREVQASLVSFRMWKKITLPDIQFCFSLGRKLNS